MCTRNVRLHRGAAADTFLAAGVFLVPRSFSSAGPPCALLPCVLLPVASCPFDLHARCRSSMECAHAAHQMDSWQGCPRDFQHPILEAWKGVRFLEIWHEKLQTGCGNGDQRACHHPSKYPLKACDVPCTRSCNVA
jgi:hypothetical protein